MGTGGGLIFSCILGCVAGAFGVWFGAFTLGSGTRKGYGISVAVGGRGVDDGLCAGRVVYRRIICVICV